MMLLPYDGSADAQAAIDRTRGHARVLGGAGRRSALLRSDVCARLGQLGVGLDESANARHAEQITADDAPVAVLVVRAGEEIVVARETAAVLGGG